MCFCLGVSVLGNMLTPIFSKTDKMTVMVKRIFSGTVKCGFCGKELTAEEICEYIPFDKREGDLDEEQCPHCGYHSDFVEDSYREPQPYEK